MKLSASNIAWSLENDITMYKFLQEQQFNGLEIAPTRLFPNNPYGSLEAAKNFAKMLKSKYNLVISSIQSIWYGKSESVFGSVDERATLLDYTKKAILFAESVNCSNLVFGCPKNRFMPDEAEIGIAYDFFNNISNFALKHNTTIAIEPNPTIYGTNFINNTVDALNIAGKIQSLKVNIDLGTIIENEEDLSVLADKLDLVNHIHISEPNLVKIKERKMHNDLSAILKRNNYENFISLEMKNFNDIELVKSSCQYIKGVFA